MTDAYISLTASNSRRTISTGMVPFLSSSGCYVGVNDFIDEFGLEVSGHPSGIREPGGADPCCQTFFTLVGHILWDKLDTLYGKTRSRSIMYS